MLSDNRSTYDTTQKIEEGIKDNYAREKVVNFILECLSEFRTKFSNKNPENGLTQELVYILDNKAREKLPLCGFSREHMEDTGKGNSPQDDVGVRGVKGIVIDTVKYANNEPFIVFEAKRLDASISKQNKDRTKEYVVGFLKKDGKYNNSGGIERFKKEIHGTGLVHVGMIGYVQSDNFDIWFEKINGWIDEEINTATSGELIWENKDKLILDKKETVLNTYLSEHKCISKEKINMYHIWVDLI